MKHFNNWLLSISILFAFTCNSYSQTLFSFTNSCSSTSAAVASTPTGSTVSNLTLGPGSWRSGTICSCGIPFNLGKAIGGGAGGTFASNHTNGYYFKFTVTPSSGYQLNLNQVRAQNLRSSSTGPNGYTWEYRIGSGSWVAQSAGTLCGCNTSSSCPSYTGATNAWSFTPINATSAVEFRIVFSGGSNSAGTTRVGTVSVSGTITRILTTAVSTTSICQGSNLSVSYTPYLSSGTWANAFKVQLSDSTGVFPTNTTSNIIGTGTSSPIIATIPVGTPQGSGYRVRVLNDSPNKITYGTNNGTNIFVEGKKTPSVAISSMPDVTLPTTFGTPITFTATPTYGGTSPVYQWYKNGSVVGGASNTYSYRLLRNNDSVWCRITSNYYCLADSKAFSPKIKSNIIPAPVPVNNNRCLSINLNTATLFSNWTVSNHNNSYNPNLDSINGTTLGANRESSEPLGSCDTGATDEFSSVWYHFRAPECAVQSLEVSTNLPRTEYDSRVVLYREGISGSCYAPLAESACNNDASVAPVPLSSTILLTPGTGAGTYIPNERYLVQVSGFNNDMGRFGLKIDANSPPISLSAPTTTSFNIALPTAASLSGSGFGGYLIRFRHSAMSSGGYVQYSVPASSSSYMPTSLLPSTRYDVWSVYRCASSQWFSAKDTIRTLEGCSLGTISAPNLSIPICGKILATWNRVTGAGAYRIYWRRSGTTGYSYLNVNADTSHTITITPGFSYEVWVEASCSVPAPTRRVTSAMSAVNACLPDKMIPQDEVSGVFEYNDATFFHMPFNEISTFITPQNNKGIHSIQLRKISNSEIENPIIPISTMDVYPNPATTECTVELQNISENGDIFVYNTNGMLMKTIRVNSDENLFKINTTDLASGMYIVKFVGSKNVISKKISITK